MYDLYGYFILALFFIAIIIIAVVLRNHLNDKDYRTRYAPLMVIAFLIVALDVSKQIGGLVVGYQKRMIPLYFCSLFNVLFPLAAFSKGRLKQVTQVMSSVFAFMVMVGMYIAPRMMIGDSAYGLFKSFANFHTFIYHHLVALYALLSISLQLVDLEPKENVIELLLGALGYNIIGGTSAILIQENFHNFYPLSDGFFKNLRLKMGDVPYVLLWGFMFLLTIVPGYYLFKLLYDTVGSRRVQEEELELPTLK